MRVIVMSFLLSNIVTLEVFANKLPAWVISGSTVSIEGLPVVVCSGEAIDPNEAENKARIACMTAAAQSKGVSLVVRDKVTSSLNGVDSNQVSEIVPLHAKVRCDYTNRYMEQLPIGGFRVWLQATVRDLQTEIKASLNQKPESAVLLPFARAVLRITSIPQPDSIIVSGADGERAIGNISNSMSIVLKEGDETIVVKKLGFKDAKKAMGSWQNGSSLSLDFKLEREH